MSKLNHAVLIVAAAVAASVAIAGQRPAPATEPRILSGADVGFRVEGTDPRTGGPTGTWVVRIDGQWVDAVPRSGIRPATQP
ncbi:MAG: hypothetical protein AB7U83_12835 [Vicinamibacterales bacterium]